MMFLAWYAAAFVVMLPGIVPAMVLFRRLPSGGLISARPIGLLLIAEAAWLVSTWTPIPYPGSTEEERASSCGWVLRCSWDNGFVRIMYQQQGAPIRC